MERGTLTTADVDRSRLSVSLVTASHQAPSQPELPVDQMEHARQNDAFVYTENVTAPSDLIPSSTMAGTPKRFTQIGRHTIMESLKLGGPSGSHLEFAVRRTKQHKEKRTADEIDDCTWVDIEETATGQVCGVCLHQTEVMQWPCCRVSVCRDCVRSYVTEQVRMGVVAVECLSCEVILPESDVTSFLEGSFRHTYKLLIRSRVNNLERSCQDNSLETRPESRRVDQSVHLDDDSRDLPDDVRERADDQDTLASWALRENKGLPNAQRCPQCRVYVQKRAGCFNVRCLYCGTKFCYKCGEQLPHDMAAHFISRKPAPWWLLWNCSASCRGCCSHIGHYLRTNRNLHILVTVLILGVLVLVGMLTTITMVIDV